MRILLIIFVLSFTSLISFGQDFSNPKNPLTHLDVLGNKDGGGNEQNNYDSQYECFNIKSIGINYYVYSAIPTSSVEEICEDLYFVVHDGTETQIGSNIFFSKKLNFSDHQVEINGFEVHLDSVQGSFLIPFEDGIVCKGNDNSFDFNYTLSIAVENTPNQFAIYVLNSPSCNFFPAAIFGFNEVHSIEVSKTICCPGNHVGHNSGMVKKENDEENEFSFSRSEEKFNDLKQLNSFNLEILNLTNPVTNRLTFSFSSELPTNTKIYVISNLGEIEEIIGTARNFNIDVSNYRPGMYTLLILTPNGNHFKRFIKT